MFLDSYVIWVSILLSCSVGKYTSVTVYEYVGKRGSKFPKLSDLRSLRGGTQKQTREKTPSLLFAGRDDGFIVMLNWNTGNVIFKIEVSHHVNKQRLKLNM